MKPIILRLAVVFLVLQLTGLVFLGILVFRASPSQSQSGIAGATIQNQDTQVRISGQALSCKEVLNEPTPSIVCSIPVQGKPLSLTLRYSDSQKRGLTTCEAWYSDQALTCSTAYEYSPKALPYFVVEVGNVIDAEALAELHGQNKLSQMDEKAWDGIAFVVSLLLAANIFIVSITLGSFSSTKC